MSEAVNTTKKVGILRRLKHFLMLLLGPVAIAGISAWVYLHGGRYVTTDNAYIKSEILSIGSNVSGIVTELNKHDSDIVKRGDLLLRIYDQPFVIAVARAEANLATVRGDIESLKAELKNNELQVEIAAADLEFRNQELERIRGLYEQNSISGVIFDQAVYERNAAEKELAEKQQAIQVIQARLIDPILSIDDHPRIKQARAELEQAELDLSEVEVKAPTDGVISNVSTHVGEIVMAGAPTMNIIDRSKFWIEANFKETDITYLEVGQPATVTVDSYPDLSWHAHVASITPATGSEFSLLPAQNSSGNWVKVVQRIKVRLELDDYAGSPILASGMSAEVSVDTNHIRTLPSLTHR